MATVKGTRTEQNLLKAFAGESQNRDRYPYAAAVAQSEGYEQWKLSTKFATTN